MGKGSSVPRDASEAEMSEGGGVDQALARSVVFIDNAPTWDELKEMLRHKSEEVGFAELDPETGPTNAKALLRMFGHEGEPRIKLYRDHAAWCPYCHKVWLLLEEKRVPYR